MRKTSAVEWNQYRTTLQQGAQQLGCPLDEATTDLLLGYLSQLHRWNRTYNLTAIHEPHAMVVQHVLDSLAIIPAMQQILYKNTVSEPLIADVGAGGGLPGAVLAIVHRAWQVRCIDAVEKKVSFIRQASSVLGVDNLQGIHTRVEALAPLGADVVVSRAFSSLIDFVQLAGRHVAPGGIMAAMKGKRPDDEMEALASSGWQVFQIISLDVPGLDAQRCLVCLKRVEGAG